LAVRTSEDIMTSRSIRILLIKGARLDLMDQNGLYPLDYLEDFVEDSK
jgi:hypothetical protein